MIFAERGEKYGAFEKKRWKGLPLRSFDERLQRRLIASHLFLKTPDVMGILEIEFHTQSHVIP